MQSPMKFIRLILERTLVRPINFDTQKIKLGLKIFWSFDVHFNNNARFSWIFFLCVQIRKAYTDVNNSSICMCNNVPGFRPVRITFMWTATTAAIAIMCKMPIMEHRYLWFCWAFLAGLEELPGSTWSCACLFFWDMLLTERKFPHCCAAPPVPVLTVTVTEAVLCPACACSHCSRGWAQDSLREQGWANHTGTASHEPGTAVCRELPL